MRDTKARRESVEIENRSYEMVQWVREFSKNLVSEARLESFSFDL